MKIFTWRIVAYIETYELKSTPKSLNRAPRVAVMNGSSECLESGGYFASFLVKRRAECSEILECSDCTISRRIAYARVCL